MSSRTAHLVIAQTKQVVKPSTKAKMLQQFRENFLNLNEALHVLLPDKWWPENVEAVTPLFIPFIMSKKCQEVVKFIPLYCVSFDKVRVVCINNGSNNSSRVQKNLNVLDMRSGQIRSAF